MGKIEIKALDQKRFDALAALSRSPLAPYLSEEVAWFSNDEETLIGVVVHDLVDDDFSSIVLARDEVGRFRAFEVESSFASADEATAWLVRVIKWEAGQGRTMYPQGDAPTHATDLFLPVVPVQHLHPHFVHLANDDFLLPAKRIIQEIMPHFTDIDGNFVEQFQTTGFDARLWELYLYMYLTEEGFFLDRSRPAPDFMLNKGGQQVALEAVIVGRKEDNPEAYFKGPPRRMTPSQVHEAQENLIPLKFGSPLFSKLKKKYWELPHVKGHPLVIAIADFHDDQSMLWTSTGLINYLYGIRHEHSRDDKGRLVITPVRVQSHKVEGKEVPSGFFFQPDADNVSAVLFSASGTLSKFNRMGRQAGYKHPRIRMIRFGTCHDHDPDASLPKLFEYEVDETSNETWAEGVSLFHNPNALHPVSEQLFSSVAHHRLRSDGQIESDLPTFHPYGSLTFDFRFRK